ncbi:22487_t:CDS:1, partial [Gigaspora rosea]
GMACSCSFSPDFSLSSKDNFLQSKSLDDESEIQDFTFSPNHDL